MGNAKRRCPSCKKYNKVDDGVMINNSVYCDIECAVTHGKKNAPKVKAKINKEAEKARLSRLRERSKELKPLKYWQDNLQKAVNKYVMLLRRDRPCISCGNSNPTEAGHFLSRGAHPNKRYLIENIFPQCHECNVYKSGNAGEYEKSLVAQFGCKFVDDLRSYNVPLKEQFPHWSDYEKETKRYKKLIKEIEATL